MHSQIGPLHFYCLIDMSSAFTIRAFVSDITCIETYLLEPIVLDSGIDSEIGIWNRCPNLLCMHALTQWLWKMELFHLRVFLVVHSCCCCCYWIKSVFHVASFPFKCQHIDIRPVAWTICKDDPNGIMFHSIKSFVKTFVCTTTAKHSINNSWTIFGGNAFE